MRNVDEMRAEMKRAVRYRSGPDKINTIYLGGIATSRIMKLLGARYGRDNLQDAIDNACDHQIKEAWNYSGFQWILDHYRNAGSKLYKYSVKAEEIQ